MCMWKLFHRPLSPLTASCLSSVSSRVSTFPSTALPACVRQRCTVLSTAISNSILSQHFTTEASQGNTGEFKLVYTGPIKGAVRALKIFSLSTAALALCGGPVLVWLGKESVPVAARLALCSLVLIVSLSTTAILHWLLKGYITHLYYQQDSQRVATHTLSLLARRVRNEFKLSEIGPPTGLAGFSTFQAQGKAYFMNTEVFPDQHLLSVLLDSRNKQPKE